jgi:hypothetical protein
MDNEIISFDGFGVIFIRSTIRRIGFIVFLALLDAGIGNQTSLIPFVIDFSIVLNLLNRNLTIHSFFFYYLHTVNVF